MDSTHNDLPKQPPKGSGYQLMNNVRDHCELTPEMKCFLFSLATYCDGAGICWPSNRTLEKVMRMKKRSVQRKLQSLVEQGEIEILEKGAGRDAKRLIRLTKYVDYIPKAARPQTLNVTGSLGIVSRLNVTGSRSKTAPNNQYEHPKGAPGLKKPSAPRVAGRNHLLRNSLLPYPKTEAELYAKLDELGIESDPTYDGNFFETMQKASWKIRGKPIVDWPKVYRARLKKTKPQDFPRRETAMDKQRQGQYAEDFSHIKAERPPEDLEESNFTPQSS